MEELGCGLEEGDVLELPAVPLCDIPVTNVVWADDKLIRDLYDKHTRRQVIGRV